MDAEELYEATGNLMRAFVNRMDDNFKNVAIVAHNPGIAELHNYLTRKFESYSPSTCSWLEGEFESWSHITENSFTERDFTILAKSDNDLLRIIEKLWLSKN